MLIRSSPDGLLAVGDLQGFLGSSVWLAPPLGSGLGCTRVHYNYCQNGYGGLDIQTTFVGWISKQTLGSPRVYQTLGPESQILVFMARPASQSGIDWPQQRSALVNLLRR